MNSIHLLDRDFPLAGIPADRAPLRAPRLSCGAKIAPALVMGNRAFLRAWAARRAARALSGQPATAPHGPTARAGRPADSAI